MAAACCMLLGCICGGGVAVAACAKLNAGEIKGKSVRVRVMLGKDDV